MILSTLFKVAMTILWFEGKLSASDISILVQFSFGAIAMVLPICYINFLSQDVANSLQELAECISESQITDENWKVITIQRINSFEGFDGYGFFTLGRSHLTSVVSNFITFIIVLIQFKQSGVWMTPPTKDHSKYASNVYNIVKLFTSLLSPA